MPTKERVQEDYNFATDKVSELTRTISLSVLALVWLFIAGGNNRPVLPAAPNNALLLAAGLLVLLSLLADYLQYVAAYHTAKEVLQVIEDNKADSAKYNSKALLYRARSALFVTKQVFALSALLSLFLSVASAFC